MTILDYGCGVGGIAFNLAKACKHLYAIDQSLLRVKFIQARSKYTGVANVTAICAGSSRYLPYDDSVFDAVVMNGVLEWMPITQKGRPYQIQFQALKEINRVLKKGGFLYLGIENRFGYRYLWQAKGDNHNQKKRKIPYITAMPRFLAQIYSYLTVGGAYRCHLYSYPGYRRMFNKAKFGRCDFYFPYPNHNQLHYVVALGKKKEAALAIEHMVNHSAFPAKEKRALLFLGKTGLLRYLAQDYTIIATK
jgi:ubiquinone/menaquinone biosynthesis C-methylase UbiE